MPRLYVTRTRRATDDHFADYDLRHFWPDGSFYGSYQGSYRTFTHWSSISDNVQKRSKRGYYPDSDCLNTKIVGKLVDSLPKRYNEGGGTYVVASKYPVRCDPEHVLGMLPEVSNQMWDDFFYDAVLEFGTQVPEELSVYNFLWEGRQIGDLIPKLQRSVSQTISGGYLTYEFGWKPFAQDMKNLLDMVAVVSDRINYLLEINGKTTRLHSKRKNVLTIPFIRPWIPDGSMEYRLASYSADLRANGRLYADLKDLRSEASFWRAAAVAFGVTNPLKAFWDSIPFSFLFDWLNRIGDRIFNLTVNPFQGRWEVSRLSTSLSEVARVDLRYRHGEEYGNPIFPCGSFAVTRYTRHSGLPVHPSIFTIDGLSTKQQTLMLALLNGVR